MFWINSKKGCESCLQIGWRLNISIPGKPIDCGRAPDFSDGSAGFCKSNLYSTVGVLQQPPLFVWSIFCN